MVFTFLSLFSISTRMRTESSWDVTKAKKSLPTACPAPSPLLILAFSSVSYQKSDYITGDTSLEMSQQVS